MRNLTLIIAMALTGCTPESGTMQSNGRCTGEALQAKKDGVFAADVVVKGKWKLSDPKAIADGFVAIGEITPNAVVKGTFDRSIPVSIVTGDIASPTGETVQCAVLKPDPLEIRTFFLRRAKKYYEVVDHRSGSES